MSAKSCFSPNSLRLSTIRRPNRLLTSTFLSIALSFGLTGISAKAAEVAAAPQLNGTSAKVAKPVSNQRHTLPNGVYLYGQSAQANRYGSAYLVFQVKDRQVAGAFYMPASSFDCFHGEVQSNQIALTVVNSYEQTSYPYAVALNSNATVAQLTEVSGATVEPAGYHRIQKMSANDHRILATCLANSQH
jgi:hypothetical protein